MGIIYYNDLPYGGGGGGSSATPAERELTYAEYLALSEEEKNNGTTYYITDVDNDGNITGYTAGEGIVINDDKVISVDKSIIGNGTNIPITIDTSLTTEGYLKSYTIKQGENIVGTIDIPKDLVVTSGAVETNPEGLAEGTYIKLVIANQLEPLFINVNTLVDFYTTKADAAQVQIAIDPATREISATIVVGGVGTAELADNAITTAKIANANVTLEKLAADVIKRFDDIESEIPTTLPADGGNADTVDEKHASDFIQALGNIASGSIKDVVLNCNAVGATAFVSNAVTDMPFDNAYWFCYITGGGTGHRCITAIHLGVGKTYQMSYNNSTGMWNDWFNVADGGDADTLDGLNATSFMQKVTTIPVSDSFTNDNAINDVDGKALYREYIRKRADSTGVDRYYRVYAPNGSSYSDLKVTNTDTTTTWNITGSGINAINLMVNSQSVLTTASPSATTSANGLMASTDKAKLDNTNVAYGTCTTAAATAAKVVTISGNTNWKLAVGSTVIVKFTNTNTASNCTLNVNSSGAKQIWYNTAVNTGNSSTIFGYANRYIKFMYDGTYWVWMGMSMDANTWTEASTTANGYVSTGAQTFAGAKTFNGVVKVAGATDASVSQVRNIAAGTAAATTSNCPNGALYGQYS